MIKVQSYPLIYHDGDSLYLELDNVISRFTFTESGLHRALKQIPNITKSTGYVGRPGNIASRALSASGKIAKVSSASTRRREAASLTDGQRQAASAALRKLGVA